MADADDLERAVAPLRSGRALQPLLEADRSSVMMGELVHVSIADDFGDRFLAVIETGQGELRYARSSERTIWRCSTTSSPAPSSRSSPQTPAVRPSDEAVARVAAQTGGVYSPALHASSKRMSPAGSWRRTCADWRPCAGWASSIDGPAASSKSDLIISPPPCGSRSGWRGGRHSRQRSRATGRWMSRSTPWDKVTSTACWRERPPAPEGDSALARRFEQALQQRRLFLIEQGWMGEQELGPSRQTLQRMATLELSDEGEGAIRRAGTPCADARSQPRGRRLRAAHRSRTGTDGADHRRAPGNACAVAAGT